MRAPRPHVPPAPPCRMDAVVLGLLVSIECAAVRIKVAMRLSTAH